MKKILLTMFAGFFLCSVSMAQESPKAAAKAKKNTLKTVSASGSTASTAKTANDQAKLKAKLDRVKAVEQGKATEPSTKFSKAEGQK